MLRVVLAIALLATVAGLGFFAGRLTAPVSSRDQEVAQTRPAVLPARNSPDTSTRARTLEPPPAPPDIVPGVPTSGPPVPGSEPIPPPVEVSEGDGSALMTRALGLPIRGLKRSDIPDTFNQARAAGERRHEALDIMSPRGTHVHAVSDGIIAKLFTSKQGGLTVYQFDSTQRFAFYYAHLDKYADGLREGLLLKRGDLIGYVGSTGNANPAAPHLHFAIFELGPEKRWWEGKPINPHPLLVRALD